MATEFLFFVSSVLLYLSWPPGFPFFCFVGVAQPVWMMRT